TAADTTPSASGSSADAASPDALPLNITGKWTGSITDDGMGAGDFTVSFTQSNRKLRGGWTATFTSASLLGSLKGRAAPRKVNFAMSSGDFTKRSCRMKFKSLSAAVGQIQGNYRWAGCGKQFKGNAGGKITITPVP
ncbi:MAG: hypothetical protein ACYDC3_11410, partial [Candidatus Binataceae bacterium]